MLYEGAFTVRKAIRIRDGRIKAVKRRFDRFGGAGVPFFKPIAATIKSIVQTFIIGGGASLTAV
jgi:hypothetical protein